MSVKLGLAIFSPLLFLSSVGSAQAPLVCGRTDWGLPTGRAKVDFDRNGYTDFCRASGPPNKGAVCCTLSLPPPAGKVPPPPKQSFWSSLLGYGPPTPKPVKKSPHYAEGYMKGGHFTIDGINLGELAGRAWVDVNGDKSPEYCRVVRENNQYLASCLVIKNNKADREIRSRPLFPHNPTGRYWFDANGDKSADFCRTVNRGLNKIIECDLYDKNRDSFNTTITDILLPDDQRVYGLVN